jgi:hypothetical protein
MKKKNGKKLELSKIKIASLNRGKQHLINVAGIPTTLIPSFQNCDTHISTGIGALCTVDICRH